MTTWVSRIPRLRAVFARWAHDPYLRGRAAQTLGIALVADGVVGIDNPLRGGKGKRAGLFTAALTTGIGLLFVVVVGGVFDAHDPYDGGSTTTGTVASVQRSRASTQDDGSACTATVRYAVDGTTYEVGSGFSSSTLCHDEGTSVEVSYLPGRPGDGRPQFSEGRIAKWAATGLGWLVLILGAGTLLIRLAELVVGCRLLLLGWRLVRDNPAVDAGQVLDELQEAWTGRSAAAGPARVTMAP